MQKSWTIKKEMRNKLICKLNIIPHILWSFSSLYGILKNKKIFNLRTQDNFKSYNLTWINKNDITY